MQELNNLEDMFAQVVVKNAILVRYKGKDYIAAWVSLFNEGEPADYSKFSVLEIMDTEGNLVKSDLANTEREIKLLARKFRVKQIQEELGLNDGRVPSLDTIIEIMDRAFADEWVGQHNTGRNIYFSEIADLLNTTQIEIWPLFAWLINSGLASNSGGYILSPPVQEPSI